MLPYCRDGLVILMSIYVKVIVGTCVVFRFFSSSFVNQLKFNLLQLEFKLCHRIPMHLAHANILDYMTQFCHRFSVDFLFLRATVNLLSKILVQLVIIDMTSNISVIGHESSINKINDQVIVVQVLVSIFLFINVWQITTFFLKDFYTTMRYILFALTLLSDSLFLVMTDALLLLSYFRFTIQMWLCLILYIVLSLYTFVTPVTLTAMTLERYVAICMPLRHGELCSTRSALYCVLIIHILSSVPCLIVISIFFASVTHSFYTQGRICSVEMFITYKWQGDLRSTISQFYFLMMFIAIVFSYVKIMKVAVAASGENKKSTWKGLRTVILHGFQLLLCLIQLWCPFIEAAVLQINFMLYVNVRYYNYITFIIAPRCLSPLIYGLRDEMFYQALKYYALCGLYKKQSSDLF